MFQQNAPTTLSKSNAKIRQQLKGLKSWLHWERATLMLLVKTHRPLFLHLPVLSISLILVSWEPCHSIFIIVAIWQYDIEHVSYSNVRVALSHCPTVSKGFKPPPLPQLLMCFAVLSWKSTQQVVPQKKNIQNRVSWACRTFKKNKGFSAYYPGLHSYPQYHVPL